LPAFWAEIFSFNIGITIKAVFAFFNFGHGLMLKII
jgi:hypothetical protein